MKHILLAAAAALTLLASCKKDDDVKPRQENAGTPPPAGMEGKWLYGQFSPIEYWDQDGHYVGNGFEQAVLLDLKPNGRFEMFILNSATTYSCRTTAYTSEYGPIALDAASHKLMLKPDKATYKGEYGCTPGSNFNRPATSAELRTLGFDFTYELGTDAQGKPQLHLFFNAEDTVGTYFRRLE